MLGLQTFRSRQIADKVVEILGAEPCVAHRAYLLLVRKADDGGLLRGLAGKEGLKGRIGADPVVVAVSPHHAAVEADIRGGEGGHELQLS